MKPKRHPDIHCLSSETLHEGPIFNIVREKLRLPSGLEQDLCIVEHGGAVAIAARCEGGELLLVRQYRHAVHDWLVEIPAGRLEADEDPLAAAKRELEEETGYRANQWQALPGFFPAPGFCSERMHLFLATDLHAVEGGGAQQDADEEFEYLRMHPRDLLNGGSEDAKTLIAAAVLLASDQSPGSPSQ